MAEVELRSKRCVIRGAFTDAIEATEPAIIGGPQCKHGFMTHKTGIGKTGKPYEGYVCPETDRNQQCKPVWL
jgi:hypothetical protein